MAAQLLDKIMQEADALSAPERLRLAAHLREGGSHNLPAPAPRRKWREIRGMARPSLFGEDAQTYISRTRREADEHREPQLRREP